MNLNQVGKRTKGRKGGRGFSFLLLLISQMIWEYILCSRLLSVNESESRQLVKVDSQIPWHQKGTLSSTKPFAYKLSMTNFTLALVFIQRYYLS